MIKFSGLVQSLLLFTTIDDIMCCCPRLLEGTPEPTIVPKFRAKEGAASIEVMMCSMSICRTIRRYDMYRFFVWNIIFE
jgi:hypothetical protein